MNTAIQIFPTPKALAESLALELVNLINKTSADDFPFTIALSGGKTPELLFSVLGDKFASSVKWDLVHFFWVDERCVPPDDPESNFRITNEALLGKITIPQDNVHRIKGEEDPETEAVRYSGEINDVVGHRMRLPRFDIILLGLGEDGHTASIFPGNLQLFKSENICEASVHPVSGQKRITLTGKVINNSKNIFFIVTGKNKALIVKSILVKENQGKQYPAYYILPAYGRLIWYLDKDAGSLLESGTVKK